MAECSGHICPALDWQDDTCGGALHCTDSTMLTDAMRCSLAFYDARLIPKHRPLGLMDKASDF